VLGYLVALDARTGALLSLRMLPLRLRGLRLVHASAAERAWLCDVLDRECRRFGGRVLPDGDLLALLADG
jgi:poly-gamma-glutamate synthesis protein (capsule biosynthesis protein)